MASKCTVSLLFLKVFSLQPNPDKPEIGNIKIENLKVKLRRLCNAMISQKNWIASHFTFSF
jgi:hypothetical protein